MKYTIALLFLFPMLLLSGCADVDDQVEDRIEDEMRQNATSEERACLQFQDGQRTAVTGDASNPPAMDTDMVFDITLVEDGGPKQGVVTFTPTQEGDYTFFQSVLVDLEITIAGSPLQPSSDLTGSNACTEIGAQRTYNLGASTYTLTFGPTNATEVGLVVLQPK